MKKLLWCFILPFIILLSSCGPMISKFEIETQEGISEAVKISRDDYDQMINDKKSFILYIYLTTCGSCKKFSDNILNPIIADNSIVIYRIETYFIKDIIDYVATPAISVIKDGELVNTINEFDNSKHFRNKKSFKKYIDRYVTY